MAKKAFLWKAGAVLAGLSAGAVAIGTVVACGVNSRIVRLVYGPNASYTYDTVSRGYLSGMGQVGNNVDRRVVVDPATSVGYAPDYTSEAIAKRLAAMLPAVNGKEAVPAADAVEFVRRMVVAATSNDGNIVGWRDPSLTSLAAEKERRLVYLEGGPLGDVCHQDVNAVASYDVIGRDYYVNEGQFGFVPKTVAVAGGTSSSTNAYFQGLVTNNAAHTRSFAALFDARALNNYGYIRLIGGNATYDDDTIALYSSFAFSIVTADRTARLVEKLANESKGTIALLGESYGMSAGLETILQHPGLLATLDKAELGRNVLSAGGGHPAPPVDNNNDGVDDSTVTYGDGYLIASVTQNAYQYGYLERMQRTISGNAAFLDNLQKKMTFGFSTDDRTIGPLPAADKKFYDDNKLTLALTTGGHSAFFDSERKNIATLLGTTAVSDYDYTGYDTVARAKEFNQPAGCVVNPA